MTMTRDEIVAYLGPHLPALETAIASRDDDAVISAVQAITVDGHQQVADYVRNLLWAGGMEHLVSRVGV